MCGITGVYYRDALADKSSESIIETMTGLMAHRGRMQRIVP
jgi:asparagine synthetase B (glutamine-hydrolysing)